MAVTFPKDTKSVGLSYGMNKMTTGTNTKLYDSDANEKSYRLPNVVSPSGRILFADAVAGDIDWGSSLYSYWITNAEQTTAPNYRITYRHNNGAYLAFFDGHVERLSGKEISRNDKLWIAYK